MGFSRQEYWGELPFLPPGDLSDPGIKSSSPVSPLADGFFTTEPPGKPDDSESGRTSNRITVTSSIYLIALCETRAQHLKFATSYNSLNCPLRCPKMIKSKLSEIK